MSQQPSQWSPEAVQIFTAARQIQGHDAQAFYIAQACGTNAHLRWEVDWLMQWDRSQHVAAAAPILQPLAQPYQPTIAPKAAKRRGWQWVAVIGTIGFIFAGFLGVFIYGAYRGVKHMQLGSRVEAIERTAYDNYREGDFGAAARSYEQAAEIRKQQYGENHSKVSEMHRKAGGSWYYDREFDKAAGQYEKAYRLDLKRVGPKDKLTLENQRYWAVCLLEGQHATKALEVFTEVLGRRKESLGPAHEDTGISMIDLGRCREMMGETPEALSQYESAYEVLKKKLTASHEDSLDAMQSIVRCLDAMGRFDAAHDLLAKAYEVQKTARGFDDSRSDNLRESLCARLEKEKNWDAIVKVRQDVYDDRLARIGADQPLTVAAKESLADALLGQGQFDRSIEMLQDCRDKRAVFNGKDSDEYMQCLHTLADAYNTAKSPEKGVLQFQEFADEQRSRLGPRSPATLGAAAQVGWRKIRAGEIAGGEADIEKALAEGIETLGLQHETPRDIALSLADHYRKSRHFAKETEIRRRLAQQQTKAAGIDDETTRERMESQADAELEAGNFDAAIDIYKRLHDFETNRSGSSGMVTFFQARSLALAYLRANQTPKTIECAEEVMTRLQRNGRKDYWTSWTSADLGMIFARLGNPQKSCDAFEFAINHREDKSFQGEHESERVLSYWSQQSKLAGNTTKALQLLQTKLDEVKKKIGPECYIAHSLRMLLGMQAEAAGDLPAAEKAYRELESLARGKSVGWLSQAMYLLGGVLRKQSKLSEAEAAIREATELKQSIERRAVNLGPEQQITTGLDAELELAQILAAQGKSAEAEMVLVRINEEKAKLNFEEEDFWDVRCRAQALLLLIDIATRDNKAGDIEKWKAELNKIEATYPGASKI